MGFLKQQFAKEVSCSKTAVHRAIARFQNFGLYRDKKRSGRPKKTSHRVDNLIRQIAVRSPTSSCKKIGAALLLKSTNVCCTIASRRLVHDFNLKAFKPGKKPCLSPAIKAKRLAFAKQYEDWNEARWSKVFFLDKFTIQQFAQRKWTVCRPIKTQFNDRYTQATVIHLLSVMIWGYMTADLFFLAIRTTINGVRYPKML